MVKRSVTGIVLAILLIVLGFLQGWPLRIALAVFMGISVWEMYSAFKVRGASPARWVGLSYAVLMIPVYLYKGQVALWPLMVICCLLGFAAMVIRGEVDFESSVATVFPLLYPGMMFTMILPLQDIPSPALATLALMLTFVIALMSDTAAYFVGRVWGRHKLSPKISPKKTVEGAIAGLCAAVLFSMLSAYLVDFATLNIEGLMHLKVDMPPMWQFALVGLVGGIASQIGDLTASMLKRYCGIKDFGSILPGHGGMMDRIDGVLFNAVVVYVFFMVII